MHVTRAINKAAMNQWLKRPNFNSDWCNGSI